MKILHLVEFYYPSVGGAQEVVKQLSERMVEMGHEVTVGTTKLPDRTATRFNGVKIKEFDIHGNSIKGISGEIDNYKNFLIKSKFDVIMVYAAQQWTADLFFEVMNKVNAKKVFVPCGFSGLHDSRYEKYFKQMPIILKSFDATVYLSNNYRDINFAKKHNVTNIHVIPNGADEREFSSRPNDDIRRQLHIDPQSTLFVTVGSHTGLKGHKETIQLFSQLKIKNATLLIIGNDYSYGCIKQCQRSAFLNTLSVTSLLANKRILVKNLTRKQTISALYAANAFIFASNIECSPLVIFEAAAAKLPFFTSDVGNAKEICSWLHCGTLLPTNSLNQNYATIDVNKSVHVLEKFMNNQDKYIKQSNLGYSIWEKSFTWDSIAKQYVHLYTELL
jgi:glycosyltransferase involved in cell wall biosynthesis